MELLIHAGLNKAGSTFIQDLLSVNAAKLAAAGRYYPSPQVSSGFSGAQSGNAADLSRALRSGTRERVYGILGAHVSAARDKGLSAVVLSSEHLYHDLVNTHRRAQLLDACRKLGLRRPSILLVFRDPVSHAISAYNHRAGTSVYTNFSKWIAADYEFPGELHRFLTEVVHSADIYLHLEPYSYEGLPDVIERFVEVEELTKPPSSSANVSITCGESQVVQSVARLNEPKARLLRQELKSIPKHLKASDLSARRAMEAEAGYYLQSISDDLASLDALLDTQYLDQLVRFELDSEYLASHRVPVTLSQEQLKVVVSVLLKPQSIRSRISAVLPAWAREWVRSAKVRIRRAIQLPS